LSVTTPRKLHAIEPAPDPDEATVLESITAALKGLRFGSIEVVVHDARVVQIIRTEKLRIER
jgi:hypothetical protein